jgi:hypothetical protein
LQRGPRVYNTENCQRYFVQVYSQYDQETAAKARVTKVEAALANVIEGKIEECVASD